MKSELQPSVENLSIDMLQSEGEYQAFKVEISSHCDDMRICDEMLIS